MENVKPIIIRDNANHTEYVLEFNKESVKFAEDRGFSLDDLRNGRNEYKNLELLFFCSFRMHHKNLTMDKAMKILHDDLGGYTKGMLERMITLYQQPYASLVSEEETAKNPQMSVEL